MACLSFSFLSSPPWCWKVNSQNLNLSDSPAKCSEKVHTGPLLAKILNQLFVSCMFVSVHFIEVTGYGAEFSHEEENVKQSFLNMLIRSSLSKTQILVFAIILYSGGYSLYRFNLYKQKRCPLLALGSTLCTAANIFHISCYSYSSYSVRTLMNTS